MSPSIENSDLGDHDARDAPGCVDERALERAEIAMRIDDDLGARQPAAVDDARVVELVGEHDVARTDSSDVSTPTFAA